MLKKALATDKQQVHLRKVLSKNFEKLKQDSPQYSLRAFARKLGISPTAMSEMIHGKRVITRKTVTKMLDRLEIPAVDKDKIIKNENSRSAFIYEEKKFVEVDLNQNSHIAEWQYFAILSLAETEDFQADSKWIAQRLNISESLAHKSLQNLKELKVLTANEDGKFVPSGLQFKIESGLQETIFKTGHRDSLDLAKKALDDFDRELIDFSSMTMAIDHEFLPEAKDLIRQFRRRLASFLESGKKEEVYKLNIQLFPLSSKTKSK